MNKTLKMLAIAIALLGLIFNAGVMAANAGGATASTEPGKNPRRQTSGPKLDASAQQLTDAQIKQVALILSKYKPDSLTAEVARAMNEEFRDAGLRRGAGLKEAIEAAGFDTWKISTLYPPPAKRKEQRSPKARPHESGGVKVFDSGSGSGKNK